MDALSSILPNFDFQELFLTSFHSILIATLVTICIVFYRHYRPIARAERQRRDLAQLQRRQSSVAERRRSSAGWTEAPSGYQGPQADDDSGDDDVFENMTDRTTDFLRRSSKVAESLRLAVSTPTRDPTTGRRLRKRERALILAQRLMKLQKSPEVFKEKDIPSTLLEYDEEALDDPASMSDHGRRRQSMLPREINYLQKSIKVFGYLESDLLMHLVNRMETVRLNPDERLFGVGDPDMYLYIVREGQVQINIRDPSGILEVDTRGPGESIQSLLSVLDLLVGREQCMLKTVSARAKTQATVLKLPVMALYEEARKNTHTMVRLIQMICLRLQRVSIFTLNQYLGLTSELLAPTSHEGDIGPSSLGVCQAEFQDGLDEHFRQGYIPQRGWHHDTTARAYDSSEIQNLALKDVQYLLGIRSFNTLHNRSTLLTVPPGIDLIEYQSYENKFFYVISGRLVAFQLVGQNRSVLFEATPGTTCGGLSMVTGEPSFYSLRSTSQCLVLRITKRDFHEMVQREPHIVIAAAKTVMGMISPFVRQIDFLLDWTNLDSGQPLYKQGQPAKAAYIILNGRLRSVVEVNNKKKLIHAEHGRGEFVGLHEVIRNSDRPTTIHAVRDTELAKIPAGLLSYIRFRYRGVTTRLMSLITDIPPFTATEAHAAPSSHAEHHHQSKNWNTVAIIGSHDNTPVDMFSIVLQHTLSQISKQGIARLTSRNVKKKLGNQAMDSQQDYRLHSWLSQQEENHRLVLYQCDNTWSEWTKRCIRQADAILILTNADCGPTPGRLEETLEYNAGTRAVKMLCILHRDTTVIPEKTAEWLNARRYLHTHLHFRLGDAIFNLSKHVDPRGSVGSNSTERLRRTNSRDLTGADRLPRTSSRELTGTDATMSARIKLRKQFMASLKKSGIDKHCDMARLARYLTGTQIAVVFGGGGSRGFSHAAIIKRLKDELDMPIDVVGGTSIGAVAASHYAMTRSSQATQDGLRRWADGMGSMSLMASDLTMPVTSLFSGKVYNTDLQATFAEICIEDLWIPTFMVSTDLTCNNTRYHTHGPVWRYVRASSSYTPYLPPVCDPVDGHLILDGCYVNNLPAEYARNVWGCCRVVALDVMGPCLADYENYGDWLSGTWFTWRRILHGLGISNYRPKIPKMGEIAIRLGQIMGERQLAELKQQEYCYYYKVPVDYYNVTDFKKFDEIYTVGYTFACSVFNRQFMKQLETEINEHLEDSGPQTVNRKLAVNRKQVTLPVMRRPDYDTGALDSEVGSICPSSMGTLNEIDESTVVELNIEIPGTSSRNRRQSKIRMDSVGNVDLGDLIRKRSVAGNMTSDPMDIGGSDDVDSPLSPMEPRAPLT